MGEGEYGSTFFDVLIGGMRGFSPWPASPWPASPHPAFGLPSPSGEGFSTPRRCAPRVVVGSLCGGVWGVASGWRWAFRLTRAFGAALSIRRGLATPRRFATRVGRDHQARWLECRCRWQSAYLAGAGLERGRGWRHWGWVLLSRAVAAATCTGYMTGARPGRSRGRRGSGYPSYSGR